MYILGNVFFRNHYAVFDLTTNRVGLAPHTTSFAGDNILDITPNKAMANITESAYKWSGVLWCITVVTAIMELIDYYLVGDDDEEENGHGKSSYFPFKHIMHKITKK